MDHEESTYLLNYFFPSYWIFAQASLTRESTIKVGWESIIIRAFFDVMCTQ